ncbi:ATP-binding protein [Rufibacter sediminis]|uniref:histidine kinase n=1 Tax=Rufibacter sediminis TaxID=2762756 RepID=A0ABR6VT36_9BACT|nr:ATP-binding protein [Rufibacter sediminis]MBC3540310.1 response regulator [Rufibacter sediminis]
MSNGKESFSLQSIRSKILAAVLLGALAVALSWSITHRGFKDILLTVEEVSTPNEKLLAVNSLFQSLAQLDQLQRAHANRSPEKPQKLFRQKIQQLQVTLDSLRGYCAGNKQQLHLLDSMETKLLQREKLYHGYVKLRADMNRNEALSRRISAISKVLASSKPQVDTTVVTASKKITTTTLLPSEQEQASASKKPRSFFNRLFKSRKEVELPAALRQVEEELEVHVDTLSVARQDSVLWKVEKMMRRVEREHHQRTTQLLSREMAWITANSQLHSQLVSILRTIEREELMAMQQNNQAARAVVNGSIDRIDHIMVLFSLGTVLLVLLIFLDISRSNKYRKQLIAAKEEAEQLGQVKQQFLANMSHEIRTPLQAILGFSEQVRSQEKPSRQALDAIYQSSEHLLHIVNEVLDYSRLVSGKFTFEQRPFSVQQLVTEVVASMQLAADQKLLTLELVYDAPENQAYLGDSFRLKQILYNLLSNAIKFTDMGGVTLRVSSEETPAGADFMFEVQDTGVGISPEQLEKIFHSFEQADASVGRTRGGTGLGLSIVKALAEGQQGTVEVSSAPGQGSVFLVRLPFGKAPKSALSPAVVPVEKPVNLKPAGKVLVVDDDAFILQLCGSILKKNGIAHTCTLDATSVLQQDWDETIQLVLLDIRMPEISGIDLCRALRQKVTSAVQIFALTAEALPQACDSIIDQGFDGLLKKPFREQELLALVNGRLGSWSGAVPVKTTSAPELDLTPLRHMLGQQEELLKVVLEQFTTETAQDLQALSAAVTSQDPPQVRELLHRLAGRTGQVGAQQLSARLRKVETALRAEEPLLRWESEVQVLAQEVACLQEKIKEQMPLEEVEIES